MAYLAIVGSFLAGCAPTAGQLAYQEAQRQNNPRNLPTVKTPKKRAITKHVGDYCTENKAVVVSLKNGWGDFYTCENQIVTRTGLVTGGRNKRYHTPEGTFYIGWQKKEHDSNKYPSTDGTRNMDNASFFHPSGVALHTGSINARSHGCVHMTRSDSTYVYDNFGNGDKVIVQPK